MLNAKLEGMTALVTGGSKGIGKSIALRMAEAGADVAVSSRNKTDLDDVVVAIEKIGRVGLGIPADVTDVRQNYEMVDKTMNKFGKIDVLVTAAGLMLTGPATDLREEEWDRVIDTNLKGTFFTCQAVVNKAMRKQKKGKIILLSSVRAFLGDNEKAVYCASKGGVLQLTRALAIEWAQYNINVNAVAPTWTITDMTKDRLEDKELVEAIIKRIPLKRLATTEDIASCICYLSSPEADFITGETIKIDGGFTAW